MRRKSHWLCGVSLAARACEALIFKPRKRRARRCPVGASALGPDDELARLDGRRTNFLPIFLAFS